MNLPPWTTLWRSGAAGVFGAAGGFALFAVWWKEREHGALVFLLALLMAAALSFVFESFKEQVEGHERRRRDLPYVVVTIALIAIFELFIVGFHTTFELWTNEELPGLTSMVLGESHAEDEASHRNLLIMVLLWVSIGMVLAVGLSVAAFMRGCELPAGYAWRDVAAWARPTFLAATVGAVTGAIGGPLAVLGYTFAVRAAKELGMILFKGAAFVTHLRGVDEQLRSVVPAVYVWPLTALAWLFERMTGVFGGPWGAVLTLGASIAVAALFVAIAFTARHPVFAIPALVIAIAYALPLFGDSLPLLRFAGAVAAAWAFPGFVLGAMVPWLRRPSQSPRLWGFVAFGASIILFLSAGLTSTGEVSLPLIAAGLVFALVGALLQRGRAIERYWPILALSVAINILGLTRVSANFFDIQREAYFLNRSPLLTLRPGPGTRFGGLTSERWSSMLGGLGTWRPLPPPAFSWSAWLAPPAVAQARTAMKSRADEMRAVQATMAERAEAMHRSLGAFETSITAAARARLAEQEQRLSVLETDGRRLLTTMDELGRQLTRSLAGSLTRPIRAESVVVDDITDQWKQALKKEQSDFTRSRQDFERQLADHAAALDKARASLTRSLAAVAHAREQLAEQVAAAKLLELAMAASLGFWATIGTLSAWAIRDADERATTNH